MSKYFPSSPGEFSIIYHLWINIIITHLRGTSGKTPAKIDNTVGENRIKLGLDILSLKMGHGYYYVCKRESACIKCRKKQQNYGLLSKTFVNLMITSCDDASSSHDDDFDFGFYFDCSSDHRILCNSASHLKSSTR